MIKFGESYKKIFNQINRDLFNESDSKEKQIASVLKIVIDCNFRIGNDKYSKEHVTWNIKKNKNKKIICDKVFNKIDFQIKRKILRKLKKIKNQHQSLSLRSL